PAGRARDRGAAGARLRRARRPQQDEGAAHGPHHAGAAPAAFRRALRAPLAPRGGGAHRRRRARRRAGPRRRDGPGHGRSRLKIAIVVGTRPEIVKMAPVVRACIAREVPHLLIHTGQHYSFELDGVFFEELELPAARVNLEVGSGSPAYQIGGIVMGMEPILEAERPDVVLVEGDTNSVLAGALAASKLGVRVGHVEAGLRSFDRSMPEEINRILTDHLSDHLFAPTLNARELLLGAGIGGERS